MLLSGVSCKQHFTQHNLYIELINVTCKNVGMGLVAEHALPECMLGLAIIWPYLHIARSLDFGITNYTDYIQCNELIHSNMFHWTSCEHAARKHVEHTCE